MSNANKRIYLDSETCGLYSMMVLLQYAIDDGPIRLYDVWKHPVGETLDLLEEICGYTVVGFNLVFDWFHIQKIHSIFSLCPRNWIPEEHINQIARLEPLAQGGLCLKPANALDLLLHSRKGPYQSLMARSDIRIRRVPTPLACALRDELESRVEIDGIYFARAHDKDAPRWHVFDCKNRKTGEFDPNFKDVVLRFNPAGGLKFLAEHALGYEPKFHFQDVEPDRKFLPKELGYAPYALALSNEKRNWEVYKTENNVRKVVGHAWPGVIQHHIDHWADNDNAREYGSDDIKYTRELCFHFAELAGVDVLPAGDDDSVLACMVPVVRWHGFDINSQGMRELLRKARQVVKNSPVNINKPKEVRNYISECLDPTEAEYIATSTKKANIMAISKWEVDEPEICTKCEGEPSNDPSFTTFGITPPCTTKDLKKAYRREAKLHHPDHGGDPLRFKDVQTNFETALSILKGGDLLKAGCKRCNGTGTFKPVGEITGDHGNHPGAIRAWDILAVKIAAKEVELYKKLIRAKRFHASFNVVGTLSSRMSGGDGLNAQGIKGTKDVRCMFPLAWLTEDIRDKVAVILGDDPLLAKVLERIGEFQAIQYVLCGGDFDSFEVCIADAVYDDPDLRKALTTKVPCHKCDAVGRIKKCGACKGKGKVKATGKPCTACEAKGRFPLSRADAEYSECPECEECDGTGRTTKKIHALFAMCLFPGKSYEDIVASAGTQNDMYTKGKQGVFAMIYGGDFNTLVRNLGISPEIAKAAFDTWNKWFPRSAKARDRTFKAFCSMRQPDGTNVIWGEPADYVESFLGFRRYFTLENMITKELYNLSKKPPKEWRNCKIKVIRTPHKGVQTGGGAVSSALYGAAFQIQAGNQRAAANHEIQSPGGQVTKHVQRKLWDLQPAGIHPLYVGVMNIHDELMCVTHPSFVEKVAQVVKTTVESFRDRVPLIGMTWSKEMANWAEKKGGQSTLKIRSPLMEAA